MISRDFDNILAADIESLIDTGTAESRQLEYKRELYGASDKDKHELLADVSAFANTVGGDIVIGVEADNGIPTSIAGVAKNTIDSEILRMNDVLRAHLDPPVLGLRMRSIEGSGKHVLLIRVPRSLSGPHRIRLNDSSRFYARNPKGKHIMDTTEIRAAFLEIEGAFSLAAKFREDRIVAIARGDTQPTHSLDTLCIHMVPLDRRFRVDPSAVAPNTVPLIDSSGFEHRYNIDGLLLFSRHESGKYDRYSQLFRSGALEMVRADILNTQFIPGSRSFPLQWAERAIALTTKRALALYESLGVAGGVLACGSLTNVYGALAFKRSPGSDPGKIDRTNILLPEIHLEPPFGPVAETLRPMFDALWNAAGFQRAASYDAQGTWLG